MIKIRALGARELKQVLDLLREYCDEEADYAALHQFQQLYVPANFISHLLTPSLQFVPAIYVAASRDQVLGLIWLSRDGAKDNRWKIDQVIVDPMASTYDVGTQLVNYVINRYGGAGVQTFLAYVDQYNEEALGLLKSCGFRRCTRQHLLIHNSPAELQSEEISIKGLRESTDADCRKLKRLYSECLPPEVRMTLEKSSRDFRQSPLGILRDRLNGVFSKRWVVEDPVRGMLLASLTLRTASYDSFELDIFLSPGWSDMYPDLLGFGTAQILQITSNTQVRMLVYGFCKDQLETLENRGFETGQINEVLVKDYWIPLQDRDSKLTSPLLLFPGKTSPAVNLR